MQNVNMVTNGKRNSRLNPSVALLFGGALVNALAFSGSDVLFSVLRGPGVDEERKLHGKTVE